MKSLLQILVSDTIFQFLQFRLKTQHRLRRIAFSHLNAIAVELLEVRTLFSGDPSVSSLSFIASDYGYGFATGALTGGIVGGSGMAGSFHLDIDISNDGTSDYSDEIANDVGSIWAKLTLPCTQNLPNQSIPVAVRLTETRNDTGVTTIGAWVVNNVSVQSPANLVPSVSNLTYTPWNLGYGLSGVLSGDVDDNTPKFGFYQLQIDTNGDGSSDLTLDDSNFTNDRSTFLCNYIPHPGSLTVSARVVETDVNTGQDLTSAWASTTFTPVLPPSDPPTIDYLLFNSSGYGGYGNYRYGSVLGEFRDYTRTGSAYSLEIDQNGDGIPDSTAPVQTDFPFSKGGIRSDAQLRIKEIDNFGRQDVSAWVGMENIGHPNNRPSMENVQREAVVSVFALSAAQSVGTFAGTDADGDRLEYSISFSPLANKFAARGANPALLLTINVQTGGVKIGNVSAVTDMLKRDGSFSFTVSATDGKATIAKTILLVDDYHPYIDQIRSQVNAWAVYAMEVVTDTSIRSSAALNMLQQFAGQDSLVTQSNLATNLTWAAAAYTSGPAAGNASVAAVVIQHLLAQVISQNEGATLATIMAAISPLSDAIVDSDRAKITTTQQDEGNHIGTLIAQLNAMPAPRPGVGSLAANRLAVVTKYLADLKTRLPILSPRPVPATNDIYAQLLISYAGKKAWSLFGSEWRHRSIGSYWYSTDLAGARGVATELNRIYYVYPAIRVKAGPDGIVILKY